MSPESKGELEAVWGSVNDDVSIENLSFLHLFEIISDGIAVYRAVDGGKDFVFVDINESGARFCGVTRKEVLGRCVTEAFPGVEAFGLLDVLRRVASTGEKEAMPVARYKDEDRELWLKNTVFALAPGIIVTVFTDVTPRKQAELALRESEGRFRGLVENLKDVLYEIEADGTLSYVSPSVHAMLGYDQEEVNGRSFMDFVHPDDRERLSAEFAEGLRGNSDPVEFRILRRDGNYCWVRTASQLKGSQSSPAGITGVLSDITETKVVEEKLAYSNRQLTKLVDELKQAESQIVKKARLGALGEMASGIAHDFNNVLMPIVGLSDFLIQHPEILDDKEEAISVLGQINEASEDARRIVQRLRLIHKGDEGVSEFEPLALDRVVKSAVQLTAPKWKEERAAQGSGIELKLDLQAERGSVKGNVSELREMMMNLLLNAIDAMPEAGVLTVKTYADINYLVIEVSDTGKGMTEDELSHCMDAFYTTKGMQGTGLGLSMVHGIVERHNGTIEIDSEEGRGTTVRVLLPGAGQKSRDERAEDKAGKVSAMKVLIVDDDPRSLRLVELILSKDGHRVTALSDGKEALNLLKKETFDLVISDRAMPDVRGDAVLNLAKIKNPDGLTIMLTGFGEIMNDEGEKPEGVDKVMSKPVTLEDFRAVIGNMISRKPVSE